MTFSNSSDPALNTNQLPISLDVNPDEESYDEILQLYLRRIANAVNTKESGLFLLQENAPFEQWFSEVTQNSSTQQYLRNAYRLTIDLVLLNGGSIASQAPDTPLSLMLTSSTIPSAVTGYLYPVQGFGGALDDTGISYFINDPQVYVRYVAANNTFLVYNTTGNTLTWAVYVIEYLKN